MTLAVLAFISTSSKKTLKEKDGHSLSKESKLNLLLFILILVKAKINNSVKIRAFV